MPSYTLEIEAFGVYATNMPSLEIWEDGVLDSTHAISSSGSTISVVINYGGTLPTSLALTFNDAFAAAGRTIEIRSVKINNQYVNVGNYLSSDSLTKGQSANVDIASVDTTDSDFIFDASDPAASEFTTGATRTFTAGNDFYNGFSGTGAEVFDMLGGGDYAHLGSGDDKVSGGAGNDVLRGGAGDDLLYGGADNDRIYGGDDDDTIYGGTGDDRLNGQNGNDEIHGGDGDDRLNGQAGDDVLTGGIGADKLTGGAGTDYLFGGDDDDQLVGGSGDDTIDGGDGDDLAYGGAGADHMDGGDGIDVLIGNQGDDVINGGDGDDEIYGLQDNDDIYGGIGNDDLYGGDGDDTIEGDGNDDTIYGGGDDDIINGGTGADTIYGTGGIWYDADWDYKQVVTIDSAQVNGDLTDFTLLITEDGFGADFWSNVKADGSDILITAADGVTILDREVVSIDTVAETLEVHVRIPNVSSTVDTDIQIYYGNASITLSNDTTTWVDEYSGVWHMEDDLGAGTTIADSSQRSNDGTARGGLTAADQITGQVGSGFQFNNAEYIALDHSYQWDGALPTVSVSAWVNTSFSSGGAFDSWSVIDFDRSEFFNVYVDGITGQLSFSTASGATIHDFSAGAAINDGTWHHVSAVYDGTDKILYVDGAEVGRSVNAHSGGTIGDDIVRYGFIGDGSEATTFDGARNSFYYDGQFDDIRLYEGTLSADQIAAEYNNHNSPSTFYSVGTSQNNTNSDDDDTLNGGDGNDTIYASSGDDNVNGGDGNDTLYGSTGSNILQGDDGDDSIYADGSAVGDADAGTTLADVILADSPVGYWQLNETSGALAHNLGSGGAIDGLLNNGVTVDQGPLYVGGTTGMRFDGVDDYIHIPDSTLINTAAVTERTVELVFNADVTTGRQVLYEEGGGTNALTIYIDAGSIYFAVRDSGEYGPFSISTAVTAGVTYHVAAVFDSVTANLFTGYLDGAVVGTGATATDLDAHSGDIGIGAQNDGNYYHDGADSSARLNEFQGLISDVAIYNSSLSLADVQERSDIVAGLQPGAAGAIDDTLYGGDGLDTLYGGEGRDSFVFEAVSAYNDIDVINSFNYLERDAIDISDLLTGYTAGVSDINDFVRFTNSGADTLIQVDANGTTGGASFTTIGQINGVNDLDADALLNNAGIIA